MAAARRIAWQGMAFAARPLVVKPTGARRTAQPSALRAHLAAPAARHGTRVARTPLAAPLGGLPACVRVLVAPGARALSTSAERKPEVLSIFQSGLDKPELIELNKDKRTIRAQEFVIKAIHKALEPSVPGLFMTLDDEGRNVINWPAAADAPVLAHVESHRGAALESTFVYQGAFAIGVKRVKVLSLASLIFTSVGGPLLVIGEGSASMAQWAVAGAVVFFGVSTTALLHLITSPYVIALRKIADGSYEVETPLITGGVRTTKFTRQEVMQSARPFTSFTAKGHGFFVHKELFIGDDAQLMLCDLLGDRAAEEMYEGLLKKDPNDLDTLYNYGRFLWKIRKDYAAAEGAFTAILAEDPNDREVLAALQLMKKEQQAMSGAAPAAS